MRARRRGDERGAALVEAAIIIPLVVLLTFGAIEYGFAFNEQGTIHNASRNAARAASTQPDASAAAFEASATNALDPALQNLANGRPLEAWIYKAVESPPGSGMFVRPSSCTTDCRRYADWDGATFATAAGDTWDDSERAACAGATDRVGVYVRVQHDFLTGLPLTASASNSLTMTSNTIMALEPSPLSPCA
jgi:Flp pilus assembly protein TadG